MEPTNRNHLFPYRSTYRRAGGVAWIFFNLPCNQMVWPVELHNEWHQHVRPTGTLPSAEFMWRRVRLYRSGQCGCTHHPPAPGSEVGRG